MKVGILSDTHIRRGRALPGFIWEAFSEVSLILHAGDLLADTVLEELNLIAPVVAVKGNGDWWMDELPEKAITQVGSIKIGITHGHLGKGSNTPARAYHTFENEGVDVIIFGHSHIPYKQFEQGVLLFNPGSPTEKRGQPYFSLGLMTVEDGCFDIQHLFF